VIERLLALRERAMRVGDRGMVREINAALANAGYVEEAVAPLENASQPRPKGRPRKAPVEAA
jgi:hypothetical protein